MRGRKGLVTGWERAVSNWKGVGSRRKRGGIRQVRVGGGGDFRKWDRWKRGQQAHSRWSQFRDWKQSQSFELKWRQIKLYTFLRNV